MGGGGGGWGIAEPHEDSEVQQSTRGTILLVILCCFLEIMETVCLPGRESVGEGMSVYA